MCNDGWPSEATQYPCKHVKMPIRLETSSKYLGSKQKQPAPSYWCMRESQRGTDSSNSKSITVLFQQYSANISGPRAGRGSRGGRSRPQRIHPRARRASPPPPRAAARGPGLSSPAMAGKLRCGYPRFKVNFRWNSANTCWKTGTTQRNITQPPHSCCCRT